MAAAADSARATGDGWRPVRILSGGQSGVDRAALDVALALGIACGGWCPQGRHAEDGPIAARYPLRETPEADPAERTRRNVAAADALLVLSLGAPDEGTRLALAHAAALGKPSLTVDLACESSRGPDSAARAWLARLASGAAINIAGPRESNAPGVYEKAVDYLRRLLGRGAFDDQLDQIARP